jgi:hypothetical protein
MLLYKTNKYYLADLLYLTYQLEKKADVEYPESLKHLPPYFQNNSNLNIVSYHLILHSIMNVPVFSYLKCSILNLFNLTYCR